MIENVWILIFFKCFKFAEKCGIMHDGTIAGITLRWHQHIFPEVLLFRVDFYMNVLFLQCRDIVQLPEDIRAGTVTTVRTVLVSIYILIVYKQSFFPSMENTIMGMIWGHKVATTFTILYGFYLVFGYKLETCSAWFHEI